MVGLIFNYFLWGGEASDAPLINSALIKLEKILRHIWKTLKNAIPLAKNAVEIRMFFSFLAEKLIILLIRNLRLPFSNAYVRYYRHSSLSGV